MDGAACAHLLFLVMGLPFVSSVVVQSCTMQGYFDMGTMESFVQSDYVVYGQTINHKANRVQDGDKHHYVIDAIFDVHCVIKQGEDEIGELITISAIAPQNECAGTPVHSVLGMGDHAIVALKKSSAGVYSLHEVMPKTTAAVLALKPYFFSLAKICDMQHWESPEGATSNRCPICGISEFNSEIRTLDDASDDVTVCDSSTNAVASNMTACDLYMEYSLDEANSQSCVPTNSTASCTVLLYRSPSATCTCGDKELKAEIGVGGSVSLVPSLIVTLALALFLNTVC